MKTSLQAPVAPTAMSGVRRSLGRSLGRIAVVAVALIGLLAPAVAAQTGATNNTGRTLADFTAELAVPGFNASLGELVSVDLTMSAGFESRVIWVTNESNQQTDILLNTNVDLCAQPLAAGEFMTFATCSSDNMGVSSSTGVVSRSFQQVAPGGSASDLVSALAASSVTAAILDPAALQAFVGVDSVRFGVASQSDHQALGGNNPSVQTETFADVTITAAYDYVALAIDATADGYTVSNTGTTGLSGVVVVDGADRELCSISLLTPGQSQTCDASGGLDATVTGVAAINPAVSTSASTGATQASSVVVEKATVSDSGAAVDIQVATNGLDADRGTGPSVTAGELVRWGYQVTNVGNAALTEVSVSDTRTGAICFSPKLAIGESFDCIHQGRATSGQDSLVAKVVAQTSSGERVADSDATHHLVVTRDGAATEQLATGGGAVDAPYAGIEPPKLAFTGAETTVAAVIGATSTLLGVACMAASAAVRRRHEDESLSRR